MEGIPRAPMQAIPRKSASGDFPEDFKIKVKEYILIHYQNDPQKFEGSINELQNMREHFKNFQCDMEQVLVMKRYYCQMALMKNRFPMERGDEMAIPFTWSDSPDDLGGGNSQDDINYELVSVLYAIAAIHSSIAAGESRNNNDSIKSAFMNFQYAAGTLKMILDDYEGINLGAPDLSRPYLSWCCSLFLGQAQECVLDKAIKESRKNLVIAQLAAGLVTMYSECSAQLHSPALQEIMGSSILEDSRRYLSTKSNLHSAIRDYYMALQCQNEEKYGHAVKYIELSKKNIDAGMSSVGKNKNEMLKSVINHVQKIITEADEKIHRENDIVYCARIVGLEELPALEGKVMAEAIKFNVNDRSVSGDDMFGELLPSEVIKGISIFEEKKKQFKDEIVRKVDKADEELDSFLIELHLSALNLDKDIKDFDLPEELLTCIASLHSHPDTFSNFLTTLDEVIEMSKEVEKRIEKVRETMDIVSNKGIVDRGLIEKMRQNIEDIEKRHSQAKQVNENLRQAAGIHSSNIKLLNLSVSEIREKLNECCPDLVSFIPSQTEEGSKLKSILDKVDTMKKQRYTLLNELLDDIENNQVYKELMVEKYGDQEGICKKALEKHDKSLRFLELNIGAQEPILSALTDANANFAPIRKTIQNANLIRVKKAAELVASYESVDLGLKGVTNGITFYKDVLKILNPISKTVESWKVKYEDEIKREQKKKLLEEEKMKEMMMARETDDFMSLFGSSKPVPTQERPVSVRNDSDKGKKVDMMAFYREKMNKKNTMPTTSFPTDNGISQPTNMYKPVNYTNCQQNMIPTNYTPIQGNYQQFVPENNVIQNINPYGQYCNVPYHNSSTPIHSMNAPAQPQMSAQTMPSINPPAQPQMSAQTMPSMNAPTPTQMGAQTMSSTNPPTSSQMSTQTMPSMNAPTPPQMSAQTMNAPTQPTLSTQSMNSPTLPTMNNQTIFPMNTQTMPSMNTYTISQLSTQSMPSVNAPVQPPINTPMQVQMNTSIPQRVGNGRGNPVVLSNSKIVSQTMNPTTLHQPSQPGIGNNHEYGKNMTNNMNHDYSNAVFSIPTNNYSIHANVSGFPQNLEQLNYNRGIPQNQQSKKITVDDLLGDLNTMALCNNKEPNLEEYVSPFRQNMPELPPRMSTMDNKTYKSPFLNQM
uniref:Tyrosine-protein phosphatase non-receptor type 23 (inferred by orthology to a human protein) n=1 Tax=Strongyloides venezuelensis TaxID=75913 RepID=A0A0K0G1R9_STRVS